MNSLSIYIPRLNSNVTEDYIKYAFRQMNVGEVARVDFTPIGKKPGFLENLSDPFKTAFVHFNFFTNISLADPEFGSKVRQGNGYKFYPGTFQEGYWLLLLAKNPIQQTMMNNSQIVENSRHLENLLDEQAKTIELQAETIQDLEKKIDGIQKTVYQLLGGLFNQRSQGEIIQSHLSQLYSEPARVRSRFEDSADSEWDFWPTTRQGDANEEKIQCLQNEFKLLVSTLNDHAEKGTAMELKVHSLEEQIEELTTFEPAFTPYDQEDQDSQLQARKFALHQFISREEDLFETGSVSTHSSMPDLVSVNDSESISDSDSDDDSMPELESISSVGSKERIRNTFELCGNE
jgi:uncharacterized protein Yka (UPF0111/DUF47 family)